MLTTAAPGQRFSTLYVLAVPALTSFLAVIVYYYRKSRRRYPPGPKGLPVIGNIFDVPTGDAFTSAAVYLQWSQRYSTLFHTLLTLTCPHALTYPDSEIVHLNLLGTHVVVVNTSSAATALFDKRSSIYSDRYSCKY